MGSHRSGDQQFTNFVAEIEEPIVEDGQTPRLVEVPETHGHVTSLSMQHHAATRRHTSYMHNKHSVFKVLGLELE